MLRSTSAFRRPSSTATSLQPLRSFAIRTGLRSSELRGLRFEDVDLAGRRYRLTQQVSLDGTIVRRLKTARSGRETKLLTPARDELVRWKTESGRTSGLVFRTADGRPIDRSVLRRRLRAACEEIGLEPVTSHTFRHSFIAILRDAGASIDDAAAYARDLPATLERYYSGRLESSDERVDEAAIVAFAVTTS